MASISATYPGGGYRTDVSGGGGFQPGGGEDMGWLMDLARRRAEQKTRAGQYDLMAQREMLKQAKRPNTPLAAAPPDPRAQAMAGAQTQADANTLMGNQRIRDMMQAKSNVFDTLSSGQPVGRQLTGTEAWQNIPVASAATGMPLPQSGWDVYSALAGGPSAAGAAVDNRVLDAQLAQQGQQGGGIDQYLNSLRMYQPTVYRQLMSQKQG